jgi:acetyltransferase AlgX (SGNH hydrolase-like protein)
MNICLLRRFVKLSLFTVYSLSFGYILSLLLIEIFPDILAILRLQGIEYYALKSNYVSDPDLVFMYRKTNIVKRSQFAGDAFKPEYGIPATTIDYVATYDWRGFRKNSSGPPYNIAVIGDSYIEIGESDETTFTELLARETALSVLNLGRAWYGPYQYLELLKRYVLDAKPQYVFFCFFAGNDLEDITRYEQWKAGGRYYFYKDIDNQSILFRLVIATRDTLHFLKRKIKSVFLPGSQAKLEWSKIGIIALEDKKVPMFFDYWEKEITNEQHTALKSIISQFKFICDGQHIIPILVYIPTATQVYAGLHSADSNSAYIERVKNMPGNPSLEALSIIASQLGVDLINLLPLFKDQASKGRLLYYPFDTHWNIEGRRTAASFIASYLLKNDALTQKPFEQGRTFQLGESRHNSENR